MAWLSLPAILLVLWITSYLSTIGKEKVDGRMLKVTTGSADFILRRILSLSRPRSAGTDLMSTISFFESQQTNGKVGKYVSTYCWHADNEYNGTDNLPSYVEKNPLKNERRHIGLAIIFVGPGPKVPSSFDWGFWSPWNSILLCPCFYDTRYAQTPLVRFVADAQ